MRLPDACSTGFRQRSINPSVNCSNLRAGDGHLQVLGTRRIGRDKRQIDVSLWRRAQFFLGFFAGFLQPLQGHRIGLEVDAVIFLELSGHVVDQRQVKIVTAQVRVTTRADDLENRNLASGTFVLSHFQNRDIEGTATEVEHGDLSHHFSCPDHTPWRRRSAH